MEEKTADEMFEKLGYEKSPSKKTVHRYEKNDSDHIYYFIFNENMKIFSKTCDYGKTHIKVEELQAINKKCQELRLDMKQWKEIEGYERAIYNK